MPLSNKQATTVAPKVSFTYPLLCTSVITPMVATTGTVLLGHGFALDKSPAFITCSYRSSRTLPASIMSSAWCFKVCQSGSVHAVL